MTICLTIKTNRNMNGKQFDFKKANARKREIGDRLTRLVTALTSWQVSSRVKKS